MYSDEINPYLIARLLAVQAAFSYNGPRGMPRPRHNPTNEEQLMKAGFKMTKRKEEEEGESEGGGGGTARGYRGRNNAVQKAKEAMRRMTRK